jgi:predicted phosphoribosyltransferase
MVELFRFHDRADGGRQLAARLSDYANRSDVIVLGLPRGGLVVAHEVAIALNAPLDVFPVRKLGVPGHAELAMGAIAGGGVEVLNRDLLAEIGLSDAAVRDVAARERRELERREALYRGSRPSTAVRGRIVILVDDGLATGSTMQAALLALRQQAPARLIAAVPVGAREACDQLAAIADQVICLLTPDPFRAVGLWYEDFDQTTDDEVRRRLLAHQSAMDADRQFHDGEAIPAFDASEK